MDVISSIGMGHCAAPPGLYLTAIYAPTASAVGYDLSSLTGLSEMMCLYWDVNSWPQIQVVIDRSRFKLNVRPTFGRTHCVLLPPGVLFSCIRVTAVTIHRGTWT